MYPEAEIGTILEIRKITLLTQDAGGPYTEQETGDTYSVADASVLDIR